MESPEEKDKRSKKAKELLKYLENNRQGVELPERQVYKHMGVQENQNCTVITMRMRWSPSGANNLEKALYRRENKDLINQHMPLLDAMQTASRKASWIKHDPTIQLDEIEISTGIRMTNRKGSTNEHLTQTRNR